MKVLKWTTLEFEKKERHSDWIWYAGLIFAIGAGVSIFYGNIFFGIFLVVAGVSIIMHSLRNPRSITVSIDKESIKIGGETIAFKKVQQFWIDESQKPDKLLLLVKGSFIPIVIIPLQGVSASAVREKMTSQIPEIYIRESTGVKIADRLGF